MGKENKPIPPLYDSYMRTVNRGGAVLDFRPVKVQDSLQAIKSCSWIYSRWSCKRAVYFRRLLWFLIYSIDLIIARLSAQAGVTFFPLETEKKLKQQNSCNLHPWFSANDVNGMERSILNCCLRSMMIGCRWTGGDWCQIRCDSDKF